jgi:hypothetical protein
MEFRTRPKSNYLLNAQWQELHVLTTHWQSDLNFFGDELRFINLLVDKYFKTLIDDQHIGKTKGIAVRLGEIESSYGSLTKRVTEHLRHIESLMVDPFAHDESAFRDEHGLLEDDLAAFVKSFRDVKRQLFHLTEEIARTEKAKHMISN